jgi:hypothetical protein
MLLLRGRATSAVQLSHQSEELVSLATQVAAA